MEAEILEVKGTSYKTVRFEGGFVSRIAGDADSPFVGEYVAIMGESGFGNSATLTMLATGGDRK